MNTDRSPNDEIEWDLEDMKKAWIDAAEKGYDTNISNISEATDADWHDFWYNSVGG
jgi:hypothetical protein